MAEEKGTIRFIIEVILQAFFGFAGFYLLYMIVHEQISFGTSEFAVANRRILMFVSIGLIALTTYFVPKKMIQTVRARFLMPVLTFGLMVGTLFVFGGALGFDMANDTGVGFEINYGWIMFDATSDLFAGLNVKLIVDSIIYACSSLVVVIGIVFFYLAETPQEYAEAGIELGVGIVGMMAYAQFIRPMFATLVFNVFNALPAIISII